MTFWQPYNTNNNLGLPFCHDNFQLKWLSWKKSDIWKTFRIVYFECSSRLWDQTFKRLCIWTFRNIQVLVLGVIKNKDLWAFCQFLEHKLVFYLWYHFLQSIAFSVIMIRFAILGELLSKHSGWEHIWSSCLAMSNFKKMMISITAFKL